MDEWEDHFISLGERYHIRDHIEDQFPNILIITSLVLFLLPIGYVFFSFFVQDSSWANMDAFPFPTHMDSEKQIAADVDRIAYLDTLHNLTLILLTAFASTSFILIWRHVSGKAFRSKEEISDLGMIWLAGAMICWELSGNVGIFSFGAAEPFLQESLSTFNSGFLLLGVRTFKIEKKWSFLKLPIVSIWTKIPTICFMVLVVVLSNLLTHTIFSDILILQQAPDFGISLITIFILGLYLSNIFYDRNFSSLLILTIIALALTLFSQSFPLLFETERISPKLQLIHNLILISWKIFLIMLFFALAFSWREILRQKEYQSVQKERDEKESLRRDMNHTIRGNLKILKEDLGSLKESDFGINASLRVASILEIHNIIHIENYPKEIYLYKFLHAYLQHLHLLDPALQSSVEVEDHLQQNFIVSFKMGRDMARIIQELTINALQAFRDHKVPPQDRHLTISISQQDLQYIHIEVEDNAGGYEIDEDQENFGLQNVRRIIRYLDGEFHPTSTTGEGSHFTIVIPITGRI